MHETITLEKRVLERLLRLQPTMSDVTRIQEEYKRVDEILSWLKPGDKMYIVSPQMYLDDIFEVTIDSIDDKEYGIVTGHEQDSCKQKHLISCLYTKEEIEKEYNMKL